MTLRTPGLADLPGLNGLMKESAAYAGEYAAILEGYAIDAALLARDVYRLAEDEQGLIGFFSLTPGSPPELDLMFVADARQGEGWGARLFQAMTAEVRALGADAVLIVSHPPSVGFYERQGATRIGEKPPTGRVSWSRPILRMRL
jgi:GNAT superfamily N-acetyltransferase